ncbi:hypothetical protein HPB47_018553 [Ixodes persulcatus]|uniref:Uncharacterized protein n=1 Tax=Ixodes persulcatus TaxID=34615 RepID=A0AC60QL96_IXOPE|nr:hypothetical protein HPB47_018553 [Ixodes persulcatus]
MIHPRTPQRVSGANLTSAEPSSRIGHENCVTRTLWEGNIGKLRRQRKNAGVYEIIRLGLESVSITKTRQQVRDKVDNLNQTYSKQGDLLMLLMGEQRQQRLELKEARDEVRKDRQHKFQILKESNKLQLEFVQFLKSRAQK